MGPGVSGKGKGRARRGVNKLDAMRTHRAR